MNIKKGQTRHFQYCEACRVVIQYAGEPLDHCPSHGGSWSTTPPSECYVTTSEGGVVAFDVEPAIRHNERPINS